MRGAERTLFFSLWTILILAFAIWHFHGPPGRTPTAPVTVTLSPEIQPWFESAAISREMPSAYLVELKLSPKYRGALKGTPHEVHLGFHFSKGNIVMAEGEVACVLDPESASQELKIPNLNRVAAKEIELYLTH